MSYDQDKITDWQCPIFESSPDKRQGWVDEAVQEGEKWWDSQPAAKSEPFLKLLSASGPEKLQTNTLKADVRKFVETISDIREIATYGSGAEQFKSMVDMFNRVVKHIYHTSHFSQQSRKALQWSVALGRGYLWPRYIRSDFGWGPGMTAFVDLGPREVLPCQVPKDNNIQGSYVMTIVECLGIAEAHARFPRYQEELLPISKMKYSSNSQVRRHEFWDRWRYGENSNDWERRYCEIRHTFIRDLRINRSGKMFPMGDKGTSWYYEVPSVGATISWKDPSNNLPASRTATEEDCRVYPRLRQIITSGDGNRPLYDGPAFDWHGMMPAVQYDVDDWPWLGVGYSLLHDIAGVEKAQRGFTDLMYRVLKVKMKPPLGYDLNAGIPRTDMQKFDVLDSDIETMGVDGDPKKALSSLLPESVRVDAEDFKMVELFERLRQKTLGLNDLSSLAQLKFNLSTENFDKVLETLGPIARGIAGNMELAHSKIAHMLKYMIFQYYKTSDLMSYIGPDGVSTEVFDFSPSKIIPGHMPWEKNTKEKSQVAEIERARYAANNFKVISVPSALINFTQMQEQMKYMNALQRGWPISFSTAFKKMNIDWPDTPGADEFERYRNEQMKMLDMKIKAMQVAALEGGGGDGGKGQGKGGGRPPTGKRPPKLEQRGTTTGNPRTVVSQTQ